MSYNYAKQNSWTRKHKSEAIVWPQIVEMSPNVYTIKCAKLILSESFFKQIIYIYILYALCFPSDIQDSVVVSSAGPVPSVEHWVLFPLLIQLQSVHILL